MYEPARPHASNAAFIWPALLAASASEMAAHFAKQFTSLAIGLEGETPPTPQWTTPHRVALKPEDRVVARFRDVIGRSTLSIVRAFCFARFDAERSRSRPQPCRHAPR